MFSRAALAALATVAVVASCADDGRSGDAPAEPTVIFDLGAVGGLVPGDVIALRADDAGGVEWVERRTGRILRLADLAPFLDRPATVADVEVVGMVDVTGADGARPGEQRGLLGQTVIDDVRYVAWTDAETTELRIGAMPARPGGADGGGDLIPTVDRIVWNGGPTAGGAVGGHLEAVTSAEGGVDLLLGIGQLTDWAKANGSGAIVTLDPGGPADQAPTILSDGYINPFAFQPVDGGPALWVADNAVGDDSERIGRGDTTDRGAHARTAVAPRAPSALIALPDGHIGVCGFLDGELQAWRVTGDDGALPAPQQGETLAPCLTGAALVPAADDGRGPLILTATADAIVATAVPPP